MSYSFLRQFLETILHAKKSDSQEDGYRHSLTQQGFTLIEMLVVMIIVGVLAAIAAPAWLGFINNQRLGKVQGAVFRAIKSAQSESKKNNVDYWLEFRINGSTPEYSVTRKTFCPSPTCTPAVAQGYNWQKLDDNQLTIATTITGSGTTTLLPNVIGFNAKGLPVGYQTTGISSDKINLPIRIAIQSNTGRKRCLSITTLLGSIQTGVDAQCP